MKFKKIIAIATAAAFAFTGTAYAETGENLATEGTDVTAVIEDISLTGERIEAEETSFYTDDVTVNFSLYDETGISSVAVVVNGEKLAEKKYDTSDCMETADGEVMNADSTIETEGTDALANTTEPLTTVSDSLVISADQIKALEEAKAEEVEAAPVAEPETEPAVEETTAPIVQEESTTDEVNPAVEPKTDVTEPEAAVTEPEVEPMAEPATEATEPSTEPAAEPEPTTESDPVADSTYNAEIIVTDINGNVETKEFDFNAIAAETSAEEQEAVGELKAAGLGDAQVIDANTFRIEVNITCQTTTIYKRNMEGVYEPVKVSVCSTGLNGKTPTGTFTIGPYKTKCARSRWALMSSGKAFAQYLVRIRHGICFHSVIYSTRGDNSKMYRKEYNKLGKTASAGCVRLRVIDAKWIYDHCPNGTKVKIYKSSVASPLGVPTYNKLSTSNKFSWDPTDPDTGNPFLGGKGKPTGIYLAFEDGMPIISLDPDLTKHYVFLSDSRLTYNGKVQKPSVQIYGLTKDTNYTVAYPEGCKNVGTYTIKITGIGTFTGTRNVTYQIVPQSTKVTSLKRSGKKKFKVKYKKIKKQISGYEIMYSKNKNFSKGNKTTRATGYKAISKTVKTPSKGTYYVKVRVYKTINKTTYYGNWSNVKKVKVK